MRVFWLRTLAVLTVVVLGFVSGCGGGDKVKPTFTETRQESNLLLTSSDAAAKASSFEATFTSDVKLNERTIGETGTILFRSPSDMYMKLVVAGQATEILVLPPDEYVNVGGRGWYSLGDEVFNADAYAQYASSRGPIDYSGIVKVLKGIKQLPDELIDGKSHEHYAGTFDMKDAIGKVPSDVFKPGVKELTQQFFDKPASLEAWVDPESGYPRRAAVDMEVSLGTTRTDVHMVLDYRKWDEAVAMPVRPRDSKPYAELTGGMSPADLAYVVQYSGTTGSLGTHIGDLADYQFDDIAYLSSDDRESVTASIVAIRADLDALEALEPTDRFEKSHKKLLEGAKKLRIALDQAEKEMEDVGSGDGDRAMDAAEQAAHLFDESRDLYKEELPDGQ